MSIFSRFFRRGRSSKTASATSNKADFDDPPPPYLEKTSKHKLPDSEENLVYRLQCFITRLLRVRYDIQGEIWDIDKDTTCYDHYFDLCKKYCMLLGMQLSTRQEVLATKQELLRVIFEPARVLGIPADVMEWFLFFARKMPNKLPPKHEFEVARIAPYPLGMLLCLVVDYTLMIDAAVEPHFPGLAPRLKDRCLVLHQLYFPWMLDLRLIKPDQMAGTLQNYRHLGCPVESRHKGPNKIRKHHSSSSISYFPIAYTPHGQLSVFCYAKVDVHVLPSLPPRHANLSTYLTPT
ncbi:hypothetical protein KCU81_g6704, partial [Aureobasidium melanogenum]|uniref:Uncharacterized protein n=1 Tax=Aureobasidium melanogenum (strain CBS 110374) TaxID=1043003 RepID=A0A074VSW5_AURM1